MSDLEDIELDLLLEGIYRVYGMDFRQYARTSLRRRVRNLLQAEKLTIQAIDLSARGLSKLARYLEKRRQERQRQGN